MPIFDQGYQHFRGRLSGHAWRWATVARQGVRAQFRGRGTRIIILLSMAPAITLAGVMILWGLFEQKSALIQPILAMMEGLPGELKDGPKHFRVSVWTMAFYYFFNIQMFFSMLLVLFVGPSLISQDLRFNAIPLYFSRPLRRIDYFLGKLGVIGFYLAAVTIVPVFLAYLLGIGFSLDFSVIADTTRILWASLIYSAIVVASAGTLMLAISSLSRNSRYVGAIWLGAWIVTNIVTGALVGLVRQPWCFLVSYTANFDRLCRGLLDTESALKQLMSVFRAREENRAAELLNYPWYWSAAVLVGLFGISVWILSYRVRTLDRLK